MPKPPPPYKGDGRTEISPLTGKRVFPGSNRTGVKSKPGVKKTGTPPKPIDWNQLATLAGLHCTQEEAAGFLGVSVSTLWARYEIEHNDESFGDFMRRNRDGGKAKLRVMQLESANKGSVPMQIFLGKNWLGQSDRIEETKPDENPVIEITEINIEELLLAAKPPQP